MRCQVCDHAPLEHVVSLGYMPPVNWMVPVGQEAGEQTWLPTDMMRCPECELVQLGHVGRPEVVFPAHYPYTTGSTRQLCDNFAQLAREAIPMLGLRDGDLVVDIGSNDGTLLSYFKLAGMNVLGIEPTDVAFAAMNRGIQTVNRFFDRHSAEWIRLKYGPAKLVTCANCFAHMPDPNGIVEGIKTLLDDDGTFVSESHYLVDLLWTTQYDTIYHEHLRYYSLTSLGNLLSRHGMRIDVSSRIPTHGGSIRVYARSRKGAHEIDVDDEPRGDAMERTLLSLIHI